MSQVIRTSLSCPRCGQSFPAIIEQIVDVGRDPQAKTRFLSGRVNMVSCPNCGHALAVGTPILYHDPAKELLMVYVPMELNISTQERERVIGDLTRRLMDSIPPDQRKGYLFQPRQALTIPGMIDTILEADGVTAEMRESQRDKLRVMEMFLQVSPDQWLQLVQDNDARIDEEFFAILLATAESAAQTGKQDMSEALLILYNFLVENTTIGQEAIQEAQNQEAIVHEVADQLQVLGSQITREDFMEMALSFAGDEPRIQALVGLMRPAMDYQFFNELTNKIMQVDGEEREKLVELRAQLLEFTAAIDQQTQAVLKRATDTLRLIASSEDVEAAIRPRLDLIDDTFLAVLQANIQAAEQAQDLQAAARLKLILQKTLEIIRESAPPEIRFINDLMSTADDQQARTLIDAQVENFGPELLDVMEAVAQDLDENNQAGNARRLRALGDYAAGRMG